MAAEVIAVTSGRLALELKWLLDDRTTSTTHKTTTATTTAAATPSTTTAEYSR